MEGTGVFKWINNQSLKKKKNITPEKNDTHCNSKYEGRGLANSQHNSEIVNCFLTPYIFHNKKKKESVLPDDIKFTLSAF